MGFGPAAVLGVAAAGTGRPAIALVGDGGFGAQPNVVATAVEMGVAPIWVVMNNASFGTIAGLERKHYGTSYGCDFEVNGQPYTPGLRADGPRVRGRRVEDRRHGRTAADVAARRGARSPSAHRRPDGEHAGPDAGIVGHRADLSGCRWTAFRPEQADRPTHVPGDVSPAARRRGPASHALRSGSTIASSIR